MNLIKKDFKNVSEFLRKISKEASKVIFEIYKNEFDYTRKEDGSPLTKADIESNRIICRKLKREFPNIPIISEESQLPEICKSMDFFLVDPLDGTKEFINKNGEFTVNIAFIKNQIPILGIIDLPSEDIQYFTDGTNSYKSQDNKNSIIKAKRNKELTITVSRSHIDEKTKKFLNKIDDCKVVKKGSSIKLCMIAEGHADIYIRFGNTNEWDIAAGHAILRNANGNVFDIKSMNQLIYGKKDFLNKSFVAVGLVEKSYINNQL
jgi:3'(2'), 5'-bisphosphate nucleotidase